MNIGDIITPDRVELLGDVNSKKRALEEISRLLAAGTSALEADVILASLVSREKLGSTGLGGGVAIPHGRMRGIEDSVGAFIRVNEGLDYEASDGEKVDMIFGLLVPQDCNEEHLKVLAHLAEMFLDEGFCAKARATTDPKVLHELLISYAPASA